LPNASAATSSIGPLPYLSAADSPFLSDPTLVTVLEDFEDGALNVPGIVNREIFDERFPGADGLGIVLAPGPQTDSVDAGGRSFSSTFFVDTIADGNAYSVLSFRLDRTSCLSSSRKTPCQQGALPLNPTTGWETSTKMAGPLKIGSSDSPATWASSASPSNRSIPCRRAASAGT
jgi:hypothetical protein